jgi:hypothetical protein
MTESHIDYDAKVQDALRNVVRAVLKETAVEGLKGDHHFYIAFKTQAPGVNIPAQLISRFPDEMTIVLQHKFWGLTIHDDRFEIGLSFNQKPEHLEIPFDAIVGFVDPSVQFALQFHDDQDAGDQTTLMPAIDPKSDQNIGDSNDEQLFIDGAEEFAATLEHAKDDPVEEDSTQEEPRDNVVTLDAFRKK